MRAKPKGSLKAAVFNEVKTEKPPESRKKQPETFTICHFSKHPFFLHPSSNPPHDSKNRAVAQGP